MKTAIAKIISGGQTGADRGGLDATIQCSVPHGGWCPKGRKAEDGVIPTKFRLVETESSNYLVRTEQNVIDSHATVIFTCGPLTGGSKKTAEFANKYQRPWLHVDLAEVDDMMTAARHILEWLSGGGLHFTDHPPPSPNPVLNIAGSRESKSPGIQKRVTEVVRLVLDFPGYPPRAE